MKGENLILNAKSTNMQWIKKHKEFELYTERPLGRVTVKELTDFLKGIGRKLAKLGYKSDDIRLVRIFKYGYPYLRIYVSSRKKRRKK